MSFTTLRSIYDIPTISFNYRAGRLTSHPESLCEPSPAINQRISLIFRDITTVSFDAIVNAANPELAGGSGVNGAIRRAAGPGLDKECLELGGCPVGQAVITGAYKLPAKHVIHAVGPCRSQDQPPDKEALTSCYTGCLVAAEEAGCRSIGFCCISTDIYMYPKPEAAQVACSTVRRYLEQHPNSTLERVVFVTYCEENYAIYKSILPQYFPDA